MKKEHNPKLDKT